MGDRFKGKVALVTGGGRGIGHAVALLLAEEGASVVVNDLGCEVDGTGASHEPADRVVREIRGKGGKAVANYENVATMAGGESAVKAAVDSFGKLDILVNAAGSLRDRMIYQMSAEDFGSVLEGNAKAAFTTIKHAGILLRQQRGGRIVNMTSDAGLGAIGRSNYAAASEAIVGLTRTVARDLGRYGVTCNAVSPLARTRLFPGAVDEQRGAKGVPGPNEMAAIAPQPPLSEWKDPGSADAPENVAPLVAWLCTDAAANINGYVLGARGGDVVLYSNPQIERSIHKWGAFTVDDLDSLVPRTISFGLSPERAS